MLIRHAQVRYHIGYVRGIAYDLPRMQYFFIPKVIAEIFMRNTHISDAQFEEQLKGAGLSTEEWRAFLIREELIFECPEEFIDQFPDIDLLLERPGHIDSSVIRIPSINGPVVKALERVGCQHIAVLLKSSEIGLIPSFFRNLDITSITSASLHFEDVPTQRIIQNLNSDRAQYGRLRFIGVHGDADMIPTDGHHLAMHVLPNPRGNLHTPFLTMNQEVYMDALRSNSYFKRKIFIDDQGRISDDGANWSRPNIPSKLPNAIKMHLSSDDEPDIWNICKDDIAICHDCELRYMGTSKYRFSWVARSIDDLSMVRSVSFCSLSSTLLAGFGCVGSHAPQGWVVC